MPLIYQTKPREPDTFSNQIFEAVIKDINYDLGTCTLKDVVGVSNVTEIQEVFLPYLAGTGNSGIFYTPQINSRVIGAYTAGTHGNIVLIIGFVPTEGLHSGVYAPRVGDKNGLNPYPRMNADNLIIRGEGGSKLVFENDGDLSLTSVNGGGFYLKKDKNVTYSMFSSEDIINYTNSGRIINGSVRRKKSQYDNKYNTDLSSTPLFANPNYRLLYDVIGFYNNSRPFKNTRFDIKRNPELTEYRMVINEFATDSMFTGFDDEVKRSNNQIGLYDYSETYPRNRDMGNVLHLAEHELIEIIGGNVVDINGNILDINYRKLVYGNNNKPPSNISDIEYDRSRRISRRGIGYHMQLSTNTKRDDPSESKSNFVFDIDKEGLVKFNIPASSSTGNIPFSSNAIFAGNSSDSVKVKSLNPSAIEPVPVTLRGEDGRIIYPKNEATYRKTGVRYSNGDDYAYFPYAGSSNGEIRVNSTKYHNMYAAAERLIANKISKINIPEFDQQQELTLKPFEVDANSSEEHVKYRSTVHVIPDPPAIDWGGGGMNGVGISIAGKYYEDDDAKYPPFSNSFTSKNIGNEIGIELGRQGQGAKDPGGKSINANIEGAVEASVGKDNYDGKSILLDTAGSIIAWLGKDRNGRSAVIQTDGEFLLNVGGSYPNTTNGDPIMNKGRFELRVNVTDKKFVISEDFENNPGMDSDFIISISENGLVIAGMKENAPMVIRNDGDLLLESSRNLILKGNDSIQIIDTKGIKRKIDPSTISYS